MMFVYILVSIETLFGILANSFVVLAVVCSRKMRHSAMNLLIANLAVVDFILLLYMGLVGMSDRVISILPANLWASPEWICPAARLFLNTCWTATVTTFVAIAVER